MKFTPIALTGLLVMGALSANAQSNPRRRYNGPRFNYDFRTDAPSVFKDCVDLRETQPEKFKTCTFGLREARNMAENVAGTMGAVEGYQRGYAYGLRVSIDQNDDDYQARMDGARLVDNMGNELSRADAVGAGIGQADGASAGASEARARFHDAVDSGQFPSDQFQVPSTMYNGVPDGYESELGRRVPTPAEVINAQPDLNRYVLRDIYRRRAYFDYYDDPFYQRRVGDLYRNDGLYSFETRYWDSPNAMFTQWKRRTKLSSHRRYMTLNDGKPTNTDGSLVFDHKKFFEATFKKAYGHYAKYEFSKEYFINRDWGFSDGYDIGEGVGRQIARRRGQRDEFNRRFQIRTVNAYKDSYRVAFGEGFNSTFDDYANNPKIDIQLKSITGEDADGIIQPGEKVKLTYKVINAGGKGTNLTAKVTGDVDQTRSENNSVSALRSKTITTGLIARIDPRLSNSARARITLDVNGKKDTLNQAVTRAVQLAGTDQSLNTLKGGGIVRVKTRNVSNRTTSASVKAIMKIEGKTFRAQGTQIGAGQTQELHINFNGINPLKLIKGEVRGELTVMLGESVVENKTMKFSSSDRTTDAISYFNELANERGTVPTNSTWADQIEDIKTYIILLNDKETDRNSGRGGHNMYRKEPFTTVVGKLATMKTSMGQSENAKAEYSNLAESMRAARSKFKRFLFWAPKKKHYTKLIDQIAGKN